MPAAEFQTADEAANHDTVEKTTVKRTTTRRRPTRAGIETDTKTDYAKDVKVVDEHHHTVAEHVEHTRSVDKQVVPHQRRKKGLLGRIFGGS
jgi:hypothetical protein